MTVVTPVSHIVSNGLDRLRIDIRPVATLSLAERDELCSLLSIHYECIRREQFDRDLDEKQLVLIGRGAVSGVLRGFCTLRTLSVSVAGDTYGIVVAGDTLLSPEDWASGVAVRGCWQQLVKMARESPIAPVYWVSFLESFRVYRLLGGLFREYFPRPVHAIPDGVRQVRDIVSRGKYRHEFDDVAGVIRPQHRTPIRPGKLVHATAPIGDPASEFFVRCNPGYLKGDYLACVADMSVANWTPLAHRLLRN